MHRDDREAIAREGQEDQAGKTGDAEAWLRELERDPPQPQDQEHVDGSGGTHRVEGATHGPHAVELHEHSARTTLRR